MNEFLQIIQGTPLYVYAILIYLVFVGIKSIKPRIVYLPKLFIIPFILLAIKYKTFLAIKYKTFLSGDALVFYFVIMLGVIGGFLIHSNNKVKIIKNAQSIEMPGNYATLLILLSFFIVKYYFGYLKSTQPDLALKYSFIENTASGLFSGYFIGRALRYTYKYLKGSYHEDY